MLDGELGDSQEERLPLSLVVLDCDDFKDVNDRAGHEFGDALLREVGLVLREVCPRALPARLGGDEFVVLLPGVEAEAAVEAIERLRRELSEGLDEAGFPLRLSAGISTYPYDGGGATQLLRAADQALYGAKARGKNRIVCFREVVRVRGRAPAPGGPRPRASDASTVDVMDAVTAIWAEQPSRTCSSVSARRSAFVVGATGTAISRVDGPNLVDLVTHALRDIDISDDNTYLIADYPVTQEVLETPCIRSVSFLDEDLDAGEAFVLRELQMNCGDAASAACGRSLVGPRRDLRHADAAVYARRRGRGRLPRHAGRTPDRVDPPPPRRPAGPAAPASAARGLEA